MKKVRLSSIAAVNAGGTPSRSNLSYWNGDIPWVKISDIQGKHVQTYEETITEEGLKNSSAKLFSKGTILYTIFATLGRVGILDFDATTNQAIAGINILDETIDCDYLYYFLRSQEKKVKAIGKGAAQQNINLKILRDWLVPIRSKEEQTNIAGSLEKIESAISAKTELLNFLDSLVKSRFMEMFGNVATHESLSSLTTKITDGSHLPPNGINQSEYLMLSSQNVHNELSFEGVRYLSKEDFEKENQRTDIQPNDVLLTIVGTIGRTHVVKPGEKYVFQRSVGVIKPMYSKLDGTYLANYLQTPAAISQLESGGHGSSQKGIYLQDLKKLQIPTAEFAEQKRFASFVNLVDKSRFVVHSRYFL